MGIRSKVLLVLGASIAVGSPAPSAAIAQTPAPERLVTFVARTCPSYQAISANRARNNIQESLENLGADTTYTGGEPVVPDREQAAQPTCTPLPNWRFTLGPSYRTRASVGKWGALSIVTDPFSTDIVTQQSTALLDRNGDDTGETLAGAVTIALTEDQINLAARAALWAQGGTPTDPVLDQLYPDRFGFGALRCAIDNLNGDNVEFISYPQGARHVFCFAYYVQPPPTAGTIIVRKQLDAPAGTAPQAFRYTGNISYTPDQSFTLVPGVGSPAAETFYRAGGQTWSFTENAVPGWQRESVSCTSATQGSQTAVDTAAGAVSVTLAAGDTVTCTYTNKLAPPSAGLQLSKITVGGVGAFDFSVDGPESWRPSLTTTVEDQAVGTDVRTLAAGRYTIREALPDATAAGRWSLDRVTCNGEAVDETDPVTLTLEAGAGHICEFTNRFTPGGAIIVRKKTVGAGGTVSFVIQPRGTPAAIFTQQATTTGDGDVARARGDDTSALPLGTYEIVETNPTISADGSWTLTSVVCNGRPLGAAQGRTQVMLTRDEPTADCTFTDRFSPRPEPDNPSAPTPPASAPDGQVGALGAASGPDADLQITKTVSPKVARPGQRLRYRIVVTNRGPGIAYDVYGAEIRPPDRRRVALTISRGTCTGGRPVICRAGRLKPGERVVIRATIAAGRAGRVTNRVGVVSSTHDPDLSNNKASASVRIRRQARAPRFTG